MAGTNRDNLKMVALTRRREAKYLLDNKLYDGAFYLAGYSIECALKACIAKKTERYDFSDLETVRNSWDHNLRNLFKISELWPDFQKAMKKNKALEVNWSTVKDWNVASRYESSTPRKKAIDMYKACTSRQNGVLSWIKSKW